MDRPPDDGRHIYTDEEWLNAEPRLRIRVALTLTKGACNLIVIAGVLALIVSIACALTGTPLDHAIHIFTGGKL